MAACRQDVCAPGLERRMRMALAAGKAAVIARDGRIVCELEGCGVKPLVDAIAEDPDVFAGAVVLDRIVGRAAAAVYAVGRAACVIAPVMSEGALRLLRENGIACAADDEVPCIVSRSGMGACPMDAATEDQNNPNEILQQLIHLTNEES